MAISYLDFGTLQWGNGSHGEGLILAQNVVPAYGHKRPLEARSVGGNVSDIAMNSLWCHFYPTSPGTGSYVPDAVTEFHGSKTGIYTYASGTFTDVSRGGGYAAAGEPSAWRFASWGNDVWAVNYIDETQVRTGNTGNFANGITSVFKPKARFIAPVKSYMMVADINDAAYGSDYVAWSVPGNAANYDPAASGGGGSAKITSRPGQITGLVGGEFARVFKRGSIHALTYTGNVLDPFREDIISDAIGTSHPGSIVMGRDGYVYFYGPDGFYRQIGMAPPERVSNWEVAAWLTDYAFSEGALRRSAPATMAEEDTMMQAAFSASTGVIFWVYRDKDDSQRFAQRGVFYSTISGEFTTWLGSESVGGNDTFAALGAVPPGRATGTHTLPEIIGTYTDNIVTYRFDWSSTANTFAWKLITRRQPIGMVDPNRMDPPKTQILAALPILTTAGNAGSSGSAFPGNLVVKVTVSNDPNFKSVVDGSGNTVNPQSETLSASTAANTDTGWFDCVVSGAWQQFELSASSANPLGIRTMPALMLKTRTT